MAQLTPLEIAQKQLAQAQAQRVVFDNQYALQCDQTDRAISNAQAQIAKLTPAEPTV